MIIHSIVLKYFVRYDLIELCMYVLLNLLNKSVSYKQNDVLKELVNCLVSLQCALTIEQTDQTFLFQADSGQTQMYAHINLYFILDTNSFENTCCNINSFTSIVSDHILK